MCEFQEALPSGPRNLKWSLVLAQDPYQFWSRSAHLFSSHRLQMWSAGKPRSSSSWAAWRASNRRSRPCMLDTLKDTNAVFRLSLPGDECGSNLRCVGMAYWSKCSKRQCGEVCVRQGAQGKHATPHHFHDATPYASRFDKVVVTSPDARGAWWCVHKFNGGNEIRVLLLTKWCKLQPRPDKRQTLRLI